MPNLHMHTSRASASSRSDPTRAAIGRQLSPTCGHRVCNPRPLGQMWMWGAGGHFISWRRLTQMPETRKSGNETDRSDFLDSRRLSDTKEFGSSARSFRAHGRPVASFPRGSATRRNSGARSSTVSSPSTPGSRRVNAPKREPIGADDDHACARSSRHVFRSRCSGTTSARLRERAAATIEAKRFVA